MCRLMAYFGEEILLSHVVLWPDRSIIKQSYDARERLNDQSLPEHLKFGNLNADGFGIGWFPKQDAEQPCVFTSITPAWNNHNLSRLSSTIVSDMIFAHVRAAYPGMPVSEQNCHPFQYGTYLWMHNGVIDGFQQIGRKLIAKLSDSAYTTVQSFHSDSAISFALFLNHLPNLHDKHSPEVLLTAMEKTIAVIREIQKEENVKGVSLLNFVVSDGESMVVTRFVSPETSKPASLYYAEGKRFVRSEELSGTRQKSCRDCGQMRTSETTSIDCEGSYVLEHADRSPRTVIIASEPITNSKTDWVCIPPNTGLVVTREHDGFLNIIQTPLTDNGSHPIQPEVRLCLEAVHPRHTRPILRNMSNQFVSQPTQRQLQQNGSSNGSLPDDDSQDDDIIPRVTPKHILSGHIGPILTMVTQDMYLVTAGVDQVVRVWDLISLKCVRELYGCLKPISKLGMLDEFIYTISGRTLRVWEWKKNELVSKYSLQQCKGKLCAIAVGRDRAVFLGYQNGLIAKVDTSQKVSVENFEAETCTDINVGHRSSVHSLVICGSKLCSCGGDGMIRVWNLSDLSRIAVFRGHRGSVVTLLAIGHLLLSGGRDGLVRVWDMDASLMRTSLLGHRSDIMHISAIGQDLTENGNFYGQGNPSKQIQVERTTSDRLQQYTAMVATGDSEGIVRIWIVGVWQCVRVLDVNYMNGARVGVGVGTNQGQGVFSAHPQAVLSCAILAKSVATGCEDGRILLWENEDLMLMMQETLAPKGVSLSDSGHLPDGGKNQLIQLQSRISNSLTQLEDWNYIEIERRIEKEMERALRKLVGLKTVSCDSSLSEECFRGAKFVAELLESIGCRVELQRQGEDKNPVVLGRLGHNPNLPTVTFYGHYDVQPAMDPDWESDPFQLQARDGYFYGRGTSDNKGPIIAFIFAIKEMIVSKQGDSSSPGLPCNIAFVLEGEEENGSVGFKAVLEKYTRWFEGTEVVIISNTQWAGENVPCLTYGMRGMITLTVEVTGPLREVHSGNDGGVFNEPMSDLARLLGTLVDSHSYVNVPGFYSKVRDDLLQPALTDLANSDEFLVDAYLQQLGVPALTSSLAKKEILLARWCRPTLSIVDIDVGFQDVSTNWHHQHNHHHHPHNNHNHSHDLDCYRFGPTLFSVIPKSVRGHVSVRFVPDQQPDELIRSLTHHFEHEFAKLHSANRIQVKVNSIGDYWQADTNSKLFRLAEDVIEQEWGVKPLHVREGGTMPVTATLEKVIGAPALLLPMGQQSDNCHLANERIRCVNLYKGKNTVRRFLEQLAALKS